MPCPSCDATLECAAVLAYGTLWHCPRCGTQRLANNDGTVRTTVPKLVQRCRDLEATPSFRVVEQTWRQLGINEAIRVLEERTP